MTLTELKYIIAVAQEKHFGRAAQRCFVSQPTLSIAIKKLEEELNVSLFDRSSSEIITTSIGERIINQAQRVLDEAELVKRIAGEEQDELDGTFKLGLIFTVAPYLLPKLILSLKKKAPEMRLSLEENYTATLTESLKNGELDAIIVAEPFQEAGVVTYPLYDEPFFVIVPKGHAFEDRDYITTKEIAKEQVLLLTEGNCMRDQVLDSCQELASRQNIMGLSSTLQGSSINTIRHMVASGIAISILPATALTDNDHMFFSIIPFKPPAPNRSVILAARRHFVHPKALNMIRDAVLESQMTGVTYSKELSDLDKKK